MGNTIRASVGFDGSSSTQEMPSAGSLQRSTDYVETEGVQFRQGPGGFTKTAHTPDMIADTDRVTIDGMELTGRMARELGLLNQVFDEHLSPGAAQRAALQERQAAHGAQRQQQEQQQQAAAAAAENDKYTETSNNLRQAVESGSMTADEATVYDQVAAEMAMQGIDAAEAASLQLDLATGNVDQQDIDPDTKQTLDRFEKQMVDAAAKAVVEEVGPEGLQFIREAMANSPDIYFAARDFAVMRATGRSQGLTWADFTKDVKDHLGYA